MTQTKSLKRRFGSTATEVTKLDPRLISVRLQDGAYLGPEIVIYEDGNYGIAPGHEPIAYTDEVLETLAVKGWNARRRYRNTEMLREKIIGFGGFNPDEPTQLVLSGNRLFLVEGHRRHYVWWLLQQQGFHYADFFGIIRSMQNVGSVRDMEYRMLATDDGKDMYTISEQAQLIERQLHEDMANGVSRDAFKSDFCQRTGWSPSKYDNTLLVMTLPRDVIDQVDRGIIPQSAVTKLLRDQSLNTDEAANILRATVDKAAEAGKEAVTVSYVTEAAADYKEQKQAGVPLANAAGLQVKAPKPSASQQAKLFRSFMDAAKATAMGDQTAIEIPTALWEQMSEAFNRA
ncbi:MAG: hypothetical protein RBJ76_13345 [Stenomitos frigidus ULC029]